MTQEAADQLREFWSRCRLAEAAWPEALAKYRRYWQLIQAHNDRVGLTAAAWTRRRTWPGPA